MNSLLLAVLLSASSAAKEKKVHADLKEWSGTTGGGAKAEAALIFTDEQWQGLWKRLGKPQPPADLTKNVAAVVFLGQRRTGGYRVTWLAPVETKDAVTLRWSEKAPGDGDMVMQMLTDPWAVKLFPKSPKAVKLESAEK